MTIFAAGGCKRGAVAVALVITAESMGHRSEEVSTVFAVVVFTTIVSGLVIPFMIKKLYGE